MKKHKQMEIHNSLLWSLITKKFRAKINVDVSKQLGEYLGRSLKNTMGYESIRTEIENTTKDSFYDEET